MDSERFQVLRDYEGEIPEYSETLQYIRSLKKPTVAGCLENAEREGKLLFQPRCGVGGHEEMRALLRQLEKEASPDLLTLTIDSHTRLKQFNEAKNVLYSSPSSLNGYPLCAHGWERGRNLNESVKAPLQVRHGSPDGRLLFEMAIASGITAFEGGGISYNIPYCKSVPLEDSLQAWEYVDRVCGELAKDGLTIDRELFGTLSAVLVPPSISIAISILEMLLASAQGVRCISIAFPQTGSLIQDVASLQVIRLLARRYAPGNVACYSVFHNFMGAFPKDSATALGLIFYGGLVAKLGGATKIITKTHKEAFGIPTVDENIQGLLTAKAATSFFFDFVKLDEARIEEERYWILRETEEILEPILSRQNLSEAILEGFQSGVLDIPFAASRYARSSVIPLRDKEGAIRYFETGNLSLSETCKKRHRCLLKKTDGGGLADRMVKSINYFIREQNLSSEGKFLQ